MTEPEAVYWCAKLRTLPRVQSASVIDVHGGVRPGGIYTSERDSRFHHPSDYWGHGDYSHPHADVKRVGYGIRLGFEDSSRMRDFTDAEEAEAYYRRESK